MCEDFSRICIERKFSLSNLFIYLLYVGGSETPHLVLHKEKIQSNHNYEPGKQRQGCSGKINEWKMNK